MVSNKALIFHKEIPWGKTLSLVPCPCGSVISVSDSWLGGSEFYPHLRRLFFPAYFRLSPLQKHVRKVVCGFGNKSCVSTDVRKLGNTRVTDRHDTTLAVKVVLNPKTTNQPFFITKVKVICQVQSQISRLKFAKKWPLWGHSCFTNTFCLQYFSISNGPILTKLGEIFISNQKTAYMSFILVMVEYCFHEFYFFDAFAGIYASTCHSRYMYLFCSKELYLGKELLRVFIACSDSSCIHLNRSCLLLMCVLTPYRTILCVNDPDKEAFWKHNGKRRKCW